MEEFTTCLSLICCIFGILSPADGKTISLVVGSRVILNCDNNSTSMLAQLTWKMNGVTLFSFIPNGHRHISSEAHRLKINVSESQQYALIIDEAQMSHTGNYTCQTTYADAGAGGVKWELMITGGNILDKREGDHSKEMILVAVAVPCVCCLILIISLTILKRVQKRRAENSINVPSAEMQERPEDIYENCLERPRMTYNQHFKSRAR